MFWSDAHGSGDANHDRPQIVRQHHPHKMAATGWIVIDDEVGVSVAWEWIPPDDDMTTYDFRGYQFIPRVMVDRIEYLEPTLVSDGSLVTGNGLIPAHA